MKLQDRLTYNPNELKFGTSGLRGLLSDMTDLECYINTSGFLRYLDLPANTTVYIAGDLRSSTPRIMAAVAKAVEDSGVTYVNCGFIPTPAIAYYAASKGSPCIMVTGSHIPDDRNGIKFYKSEGEVLKTDEQGIQEAVAQFRAELYSSGGEAFDAQGAFVETIELKTVNHEAARVYAERYTNVFSDKSLEGKQVVFYQHSAVGRDLIPEILRSLGADVVEAGRSEKFIPIDTENVTPDDAAYFRKLASDHPDCFAIVSTDGDSDRPFVIDETGTFHRGDVLGAVVSEYLGIEAVAVPVSSNDAVSQHYRAKGVEPVLTKIGSPYVIVAMEQLSGKIGGWEVNGGYLLGSDVSLPGGILEALPTRDACLPIIAALLAAAESGRKVSEVFYELPRRYTQAGLIDNFPAETSLKILEILGRDDDTARALLAQAFTAEDGFDEAASINATDGIRVTFNNGQVAHIRPSGNAPQLRIYSNADSQERADEIVARGIAEPDGILRKLEKAVS